MFDNNFYRYIKNEDLNEYERENKRLSYKNLFYNDDALILCNNIGNDWEDLTQENGNEWEDIYQYYIIDDETARRLIENTNEIIFYHNKLDIYILGVQHYGTGWSYVLTDFELIEDENGYYKAIKIDEDETEDDNEDNDEI
jgi:hypothetical protein